MVRRIGYFALIFFYFGGGVNHFFNPGFYIPLIPDYFDNKPLINYTSGLLEIAGAIGLIFPKTRRWAVYGLIALLIAFIPSHIYFIEQGSCIGELCTPMWVGWARLVIIHPLLIWWLWIYKK